VICDTACTLFAMRLCHIKAMHTHRYMHNLLNQHHATCTQQPIYHVVNLLTCSDLLFHVGSAALRNEPCE
jgi:hypothetical protein